MKFVARSLSKHAPRLGQLNSIKDKPDLTIETPTVQLHTQGGHVPHITHEVLKLVSKEPQILQIPTVSMHNYKDAMEYYDGRISEFIGSKDSLTCLILQDPSSLTKSGHHAKEKIPVWTKNGKVMYDSEMYMNLVESFKPDMYYFLSDGDTNQSSSQKRITKAVDNTIAFNRQCIKRHTKSEILENTLVMAPIAGGYCVKSRERCMEAILKNNHVVGGFLIDGLHNNGPEVEFLPFDEVEPVITCIVEKLPPEKLRSIQGCWNPMNVIKLIQLGVDMFDTSYCRILTERSAAITFPVEEIEDFENFEINLRETKYADDFQPIMFMCQCLTCTKYSRGYIHHLLTVQELLGPVLIMIHNVFHYLRFFKQIRECIKNGTLEQLENRISEQFNSHQERVTQVKIDDLDRGANGRIVMGDVE